MVLSSSPGSHPFSHPQMSKASLLASSFASSSLMLGARNVVPRVRVSVADNSIDNSNDVVFEADAENGTPSAPPPPHHHPVSGLGLMAYGFFSPMHVVVREIKVPSAPMRSVFGALKQYDDAVYSSPLHKKMRLVDHMTSPNFHQGARAYELSIDMAEPPTIKRTVCTIVE